MIKVTKKQIMTEFIVFSLVFGIVAGVLGFIGYNLRGRDTKEAAIQPDTAKPPIIIDAGHGGMDGGATGVNGVLEKELNLAVAEKLKAFCELSGYEVIMTRTGDISLGEDAPKGKRKMTDLVKRLETSENNPDAIFISIHMNKFPTEDCKGLQIWYSPNNEQSYRLAGILQNAVKTKLQPDNTRENKAASSSIYLLSRMKNTSVLVECGFLSNSEECALLCDGSYQTRLAACLYYAIDEFNKNVG